MTSTFIRLTGLLVVLALAGCDRSTEEPSAYSDASGILQYIPADSAYAFLRLEPMPEEFNERLAESNAAAMAYNEAMMGDIAAAMENSEAAEAIGKVIELAQDMSTPGGLERMGIDPDAPLAIYDIDLVPVMRAGLKDAAAFGAVIAELEEDFEFASKDGEIGGVGYKYVESDDFRLVWMINDSALVITPSHADAEESTLSAQLGIDLPAENIADSGALAAIARDYGFTPQGIGFIDSLQMVDAMLNPSGLLAMLSDEAAGQNELSAVCQDEIRQAAANVPRMALGVTRADSTGVAGSMVVELREELAGDLQGLTAPVPGLGLVSKALISGGFSFDAEVARKFVEKRLAEMTENPWECEHFAAGNDGVTSAQEFLDRQPLPPTLYDFRGVYMTVDGVDFAGMMANQAPNSAEVDLILAMKNPESLTAMGELFVPGFAELGIEPDGESREVPNGQLNPTGMPLWVAMTDERISLSMGEGAPDRLSQSMAMQPNPDAPLMGVNLNAGAYFALVSDMMTSMPQDNQASVESLGELMDTLGRVYDRMDLSIDIHEKGVVFTSDVTFKEE